MVRILTRATWHKLADVTARVCLHHDAPHLRDEDDEHDDDHEDDNNVTSV